MNWRIAVTVALLVAAVVTGVAVLRQSARLGATGPAEARPDYVLHDFSVVTLDAQGQELDMGSGFDEMDALSHPEFEAELLAQGRLTPAQLQARGWLRAAMRQAGFHPITTEWWHFDFGDRTQVRAQLPRVL